MKIALVSPYDFSYPGGVTIHMVKLAEQFERAGHSTRILAPCSRKLDVLEHPNLIPVGRPIPIPRMGSIARITLSLRGAPKVKRILSEERFDVVHLHEPLVPMLPITVLRFSTAVNVGTFHAGHGSSPIYRYMRRILRRWYRRLDGKIAVSWPARELINKYFPDTYNIIPNGIDLGHFSGDVPPLPQFQDGKLNILFVGRMEKRKGLRYLVSAFSRLKWEHPETRLIIVGPGRLDPDSERVLGERPASDIVFAGPVSYEELPRYYQSAHIFCAPSTGEESFGIVLLEAMAAGRPIVASDIPGYASVMQNGLAGLMAPPRDEEALATVLSKLIQDEGLRKKLGEGGRSLAPQYSWDKVSRQVIDYYLQLLQEKRLSHFLPQDS